MGDPSRGPWLLAGQQRGCSILSQTIRVQAAGVLITAAWTLFLFFWGSFGLCKPIGLKERIDDKLF